MKQMNFKDEIKKRLTGSSRVAIVGIGDECIPVDRLGIYAARQLLNGQVPPSSVFLAGTMPESITAPVRRYKPDHILLLDSADTGARPGTITIIPRETIGGILFSTHTLPLSAIMEYLARDSSADVTLLGIQPDLTRPESGLSEEGYRVLGLNLDQLSKILRTVTNPGRK
jgi:hydrogenase 3 maturation protease